MLNVWCVRAEFGTYATHFIKGGYVAIDFDLPSTLAQISSREEVSVLYKQALPNETSNFVIGQQVGQVTRFLLEMLIGDYVITPSADTEWLYYGQITDVGYRFESTTEDGCPYRHRRGVAWNKDKIRRSDFSVPFQNTIRSSLTVFAISQTDEFLTKINAEGHVPAERKTAYDPYESVLERVLELDAKEFEILVGHLLTALGFDCKVTGKTGDGGVDATGILNVGNLAKVKVFVQAKRYARGVKIRANIVKQLRTAIPSDGQGVFITTANFQTAASDVAVENGFPRIGLINGHQLVDLLANHWHVIPEDFRNLLRLRTGLICI